MLVLFKCSETPIESQFQQEDILKEVLILRTFSPTHLSSSHSNPDTLSKETYPTEPLRILIPLTMNTHPLLSKFFHSTSISVNATKPRYIHTTLVDQPNSPRRVYAQPVHIGP